jgi:hypothetical protein
MYVVIPKVIGGTPFASVDGSTLQANHFRNDPIERLLYASFTQQITIAWVLMKFFRFALCPF